MTSIEKTALLVGSLAGRAGIPVGSDTPGWTWLIELRDATLDALEGHPVEPIHDLLADVADKYTPSIRPEHIWQVFVDVEGWLVPIHEYLVRVPEPDEGGSTLLATKVLYVLARQYVEAVAEAHQPARYAAMEEPPWLGPDWREPHG